MDDEKVAYYHNPNQYTVEAGRSDLAESMSSTYSANADKVDYYKELDGAQKLIIDASHPINDSGTLTIIRVNGGLVEKSTATGEDIDKYFVPKVFILRPDKYNNAQIIHELNIDIADQAKRYTVAHVTYKIDCAVLVNKGDLIGFYNFNILTPYSTKTGRPNAVYFQVGFQEGELPNEKFYMGQPKSQGVIGCSFYARSNRIQKDVLLDIDIGKRTNIEELSIYGKEYAEYFEYNIAACLDVSWTVSCHNHTHWHNIQPTCITNGYSYKIEHRNKPYGIECLSDCIITPDGGQAGDSYIINSIGGSSTNPPGYGRVRNSDPDTYSGVETFGHHSYFYVNGDAEWLNGGCCRSNCTSPEFVQAEFKNPYTANVYDFELDPISFYLTFPNDKKLNVHRSVIYFKETQNFKRYSLSYYMGESGPPGDAEELHFNYVPSYNSVSIDGLILKSENVDANELTQLYSETLFTNPTPWALPEYSNGVCTNWAIYQTVMATQMNVLQHDFDSIECRGFKIHTTWHRSTKLTEIELYSKIKVEPTLLDNVRIQTSIYGDYWNEVSFTEDAHNTEKIDAYISGNPRYFRLQIQSQNVFELKEIAASLSAEYIKSLSCEDVLLLDNAPSGVLTDSKLLEIENTYPIALDLLIDVPRQLFKHDQEISWIKFDSEDTTINGEIGPGALVKKSQDFPIFLNRGQVAINTPAYYLKNLIYDKKSYVYEDEFAWNYFKTLQEGEDVNYANIPSAKITTLGFNPVSSKYWKLSVLDGRSYNINNLSVFSNTSPTSVAVRLPNDFEEYADGEHLDPDLWSQNQVVENNGLFMSAQGNYQYERSKFFVDGNFELETRYIIKNYTKTAKYYQIILQIVSAHDTNRRLKIFFYYGWHSTSWYTQFRVQAKENDVWSTIQSNASTYNDTGHAMRICREGDVFTFFRQNNSYDVWYDNGLYEYKNFGSKVYVEMAVYSYGDNPLTEIYFDYLKLTKGYAYLGDLDSTFIATNEIPLYKVYIQAENREKSGKLEATINQSTGSINPVTLIDDDFTDTSWFSRWDYDLGLSGNDFVIKDNSLCPILSPWQTSYVEKKFSTGIISFDMEVHFKLDFPTKTAYFIELLDSKDTIVFSMELKGYGDDRALLVIQSPIPVDQEVLRESGLVNQNPLIFENSTFTKASSAYTDGFVFTVSKDYNTFTSLQLKNTSGSTTYYSGANETAFMSKVTKLRISYSNLASEPINDNCADFGTSYIRFEALSRLSDKESIVLEFEGSQALDVIKFAQPVGDVIHSEVLVSNLDDNDFVYWAKNNEYTNDLTTISYNVYASTLSYPPWNAFDDDLTHTWRSDVRYSHWLLYDFGEGNEYRITKLNFTPDAYIYPTYFRDFKLLQVYGTNTYDVAVARSGSYIAYESTFDFSTATLLTEFNIYYSYYANQSVNSVTFVNNTAYRYIILRWPYADDAGQYRLYVANVEFFESAAVVPNSALLVKNEDYTNYLAIDLETRHNLDFLRNYGSKSDLLNITTQTQLGYSDSDTSNVDEVVWEDEVPVLLLNFNNYYDSVEADRVIERSGTVSLYTSSSAVTPDGHIGFGVADSNVGTLTINHSDEFRLLANDFTIDFWFKRIRTGQEGIFGQVTESPSLSSFSFVFSNTDRMVATLYSDAGLFELQSTYTISDTDWHHVALNRNNVFLSLFIDGEVQVSVNIGTIVSVNDSVVPLIIGQVDHDHFVGYLDELRMLVGTSAWSAPFVPPIEAYTIDTTVGDKTLARWVRIPLLCGDGVDKQLQYIGIYPNISFPYLPTGGLNCEWVPIGNRISDYEVVVYNILPKATVVDEDLMDYLFEFRPSNCISGDFNLQGFDNCWGFPSTISEPTLILDLGQVCSVNKFVLHHRPSDNNWDYMNNDFNIYGATSISGTWDLLVEEVDYSESLTTVNTPPQNVYMLKVPVEIGAVKLVITKYSGPSMVETLAITTNSGVEYIELDGGFLREFEVWSCAEKISLNSEDHPIVCMDLLDQFNLNNHKVVCPNNSPWNNDNQFFQFSGDHTDNPEKVSFSVGYIYTHPFYYLNEYMVDNGEKGPYTLDSGVFLPFGNYSVVWKTYNAKERNILGINIVGLENISLYSDNVGDGWTAQINEFSLTIGGYFTIQISSADNTLDYWAVKEIYFKNFAVTSRWVAVRRNTATNFVWDTGVYDELIDNQPGIDYLQQLRLFTEDRYRPTECSWWWSSIISTFENDTINVKEGRRSLKINYPESVLVDNIQFLEGDCFGQDFDFSIKDALSFWFYVSDIDKLHTGGGGFAFGTFYGYILDTTGEFSTPTALQETQITKSAQNSGVYMWDFKELSLKTGWNYVVLQFDRHNTCIPEANKNTGKLLQDLNFMNHVSSSFGMVFRGKGSSFYMLLDGLKITRNYFYDEVVYGEKGLCLTWSDYAEIPLSGVDIRQGAIEMWLKLYTNTAGLDHFNDLSSRTLFTLVDSANNSLSLSIRSGSWFEIGLGNTKSKYRMIFLDTKRIDVGSASFNIDDKIHIALVWSNDSLGMSNNDTIRLYVNGRLYLTSTLVWEVEDNKNVLLRLGGGNTYLANNDDSNGSAIFSNVRVYNYCKTEFDTNKQLQEYEVTPNDFVFISTNNETFYNSRDKELPFEFKEVAPGEIVPIYVKVDKTEMDQLDRLTGSINVEWKVPV